MYEVKLVVQLHQRLRGPEKEIPAKIKIGEEMVNHLGLRDPVKIDENVAAQNQIHAFHKQHFGIVLKIQPAEIDELFYLRPNLQFFFINDRKIFAPEVIRRAAQRIVAIN